MYVLAALLISCGGGTKAVTAPAKDGTDKPSHSGTTSNAELEASIKTFLDRLDTLDDTAIPLRLAHELSQAGLQAVAAPGGIRTQLATGDASLLAQHVDEAFPEMWCPVVKEFNRTEGKVMMCMDRTDGEPDPDQVDVFWQSAVNVAAKRYTPTSEGGPDAGTTSADDFVPSSFIRAQLDASDPGMHIVPLSSQSDQTPGVELGVLVTEDGAGAGLGIEVCIMYTPVRADCPTNDFYKKFGDLVITTWHMWTMPRCDDVLGCTSDEVGAQSIGDFLPPIPADGITAEQIFETAEKEAGFAPSQIKKTRWTILGQQAEVRIYSDEQQDLVRMWAFPHIGDSIYPINYIYTRSDATAEPSIKGFLEELRSPLIKVAADPAGSMSLGGIHVPAADWYWIPRCNDSDGCLLDMGPGQGSVSFAAPVPCKDAAEQKAVLDQVGKKANPAIAILASESATWSYLGKKTPVAIYSPDKMLTVLNQAKDGKCYPVVIEYEKSCIACPERVQNLIEAIE
jgi:hypothetical protein